MNCLIADDKQNGELYGEHNVVETEFTDVSLLAAVILDMLSSLMLINLFYFLTLQQQMYPYPPHMYPNPSYYPYQFPPGQVYDDMTMSSQLQSDQDYNTYEEYDEEDSEKANLGIRKEPGAILNQMLDEFHLGDEILKNEKKKKLSVKNLSKGSS